MAFEEDRHVVGSGLDGAAVKLQGPYGAILLASATVTSMRGLRANICSSHESFGARRLFACCPTELLPMMRRRLPNGKTLICEGDFGRLFEVTASGELVWEYVNPYFGGALTNNRVFRAYRYSTDEIARAKATPLTS